MFLKACIKLRKAHTFRHDKYNVVDRDIYDKSNDCRTFS